METNYFRYLLFILQFLLMPLSYAMNNCDGDSSKVFNSRLGRCVFKQNSIDATKDFQACKSITNQEQRNDCLKDLAKNEVGEFGEAEASGPSNIAGAAINVAFSSSMLLSTYLSGEDQSYCMGKMIAIGTGTAGVAAQQYFVYTAEEELEEIQDKFKKADAEDDFQTQMNAFVYLKEEQQAIVELAEMRRNTYWALSAGFAAAAGTSLLMDNSKPECNSKLKEEQEKELQDQKDKELAESDGEGDVAQDPAATANTTVTNKIQVKLSEKTPINGEGGPKKTELTASTENTAVKNATDPILKDQMKKKGNEFFKLLSNPTGVALISSAAAGWNLYLADAASDQAEEAEKNVKEIEAIIERFKNAIAGVCPQGRDDFNNGRCYCYQEDGKKNQGRSRSETCIALWAQDDRNLFVESSDKSFANGIQPKKGCLTRDRQFDAKCKCRKFIDDNGQNSCAKSGFSNLVSGLAPSFSNPAISNNLDRITSGNTQALNLNPGQLQQLAQASGRTLQQVLKKLGADKKNNSLSNVPVNKALFRQIGNKIAGKNPASLAKSLGKRSLSAKSGPSAKSKKVSGALNRARKRVQSSLKLSGGRGLQRKKKGGDAFRFATGKSGRGNKVQNFNIKKKYDYKNNDIVMREDLSLWKVISNRYTNTGLRRLFSEE